MPTRLGEWWRKRSYRARRTIQAFFGAASTPFVILCARRAFDPFIAPGGYKAIFAWIGLLSIYYVIVRCWWDLATDAVDAIHRSYSLKGGDLNDSEVKQLRKRAAPYDLIDAPDVKRDWNPWQYLLSSWTYFEDTLIAGAATLGMLVSGMQYVDAHIGFYSAHYATNRFYYELQYHFVLTYCFVPIGALSMIRRNAAGLMTLPFRWLGLPNYYPGQNVYPRWLNEFLWRAIRRPM